MLALCSPGDAKVVSLQLHVRRPHRQGDHHAAGTESGTADARSGGDTHLQEKQ